jgi:O-6-methylguanine DNA methyltransferase
MCVRKICAYSITLVGASQQGRRHCEAKRSRCLKIDCKLEFDVKVIPHKGDTDWIEPLIFKMNLRGETIPAANPTCEYCGYREAAGQRITGESEETRDEIEQKRYTRYMKSFSDKVRDIVRKIPKGKTMTFKEVAVRAGNPKAARAVGAVMRTNYDPSIPCHRVIASDGSMGGYNRGGVERKR